MIICPSCSKPLPNNAKFCKHCGGQVPDNIKFCPECHSDVSNDDKFCADCGAKLEQDNSRSLSALFIIIIFLATALIIYRSLDIETTANLPFTDQTVISDIAPSKFEEESFQTMSFRGKPRNEIKLNIYAPTTQALMIRYANDWLTENLKTGKIKPTEETRISIFEKEGAKGIETEKATLIYIDLKSNKDYTFPSSDFGNIGDNLYIKWISRQ